MLHQLIIFTSFFHSTIEAPKLKLTRNILMEPNSVKVFYFTKYLKQIND